MKDLLVIGSVALDTIKSPSGCAREILGGSATYFSISASFFTRVNLVATVGMDFPDRYRKLIKGFSVDTKGLETKNGRTFRWEGSYVEDLNCARTIDTQLNVFAEFRPDIPREYKDNKYLFLANIDPDLQLFILRRFKGSKFTGCDSMNYWIQTKRASLKKLMSKVDAIFLNDNEAKMFSGESNMLKAGRHLVSLGPRYVIIKRGEYGSLLFSKDGAFSAPAYLLDRVCDPTGAGDTFAGGFMGYIAKTDNLSPQNMKKALLHGTVMASFAVENFSVNRFLKIKKKDIETRYKDLRRLITP
ncbi:MAG: PfkB family carbohydrate kinase [Candidatus Omnitrophota bacterium]